MAAPEAAVQLLFELVLAAPVVVRLHSVPAVAEAGRLPVAGEQAALARAAPHCCAPWIRGTLMGR